jgi:REP element-mobilizing transposase RayT
VTAKLGFVPAKPRDTAPGIHHVWVNATSHWPYFVDDVDRLTWIRLLIRVSDRHGWRVLAFCQMTTHVHALLEVGNDTLPLGMEYLNREYGKDFNARHGRHGHLVRKRYGSRRVEDRRDLLGAYAYVVLNPVAAGACTRPEDWRWSSYATTIALTNDFPFVNASLVLAETGGLVDQLRAFVDARAASRVHSRHVR